MKTAPHAAETGPKTKVATVIDLLKLESGADLGEIAGATGWQKHTVRAALTGLRKKGFEIERTRVDGASRYSIKIGAPQ